TEPDEEFSVNLSNPVNAVLNVASAKGIILNDDPKGQGYWLVASDGGIFSYADSTFHGSTGSIKLNQPIVGMSPTPSGLGYWMVAATAASSPSATPRSTVRPGASNSTSRSWGWRRRRRGRATGWWRPTAACSPSTPRRSARP